MYPDRPQAFGQDVISTICHLRIVSTTGCQPNGSWGRTRFAISPVPEMQGLLLTMSQISTSSSERFPFEIWEQIIEEIISFRNQIALEATCSPVTYLAFKATSINSSSMYICSELEATRKILRLVCRAWKVFVDDWKYRGYWMGLSNELGNSSPGSSTWSSNTARYWTLLPKFWLT